MRISGLAAAMLNFILLFTWYAIHISCIDLPVHENIGVAVEIIVYLSRLQAQVCVFSICAGLIVQHSQKSHWIGGPRKHVATGISV